MGQLEDMTTFVRIVEAGGISKAASQLGVVKSAVSRRLVDLENRLGTQLLYRTTRASSLTEAGRSYYQRALQILDDVSELNAITSSAPTLLEGTLRIAVPLSFGLLHLAPVVTEFAELHPELSLDLDFSDRQVDLVEEGFDIAIRIAQLQDTTHIARRLAPIRRILCASPDYLERTGTPKIPEDLRNHTALAYAGSGSSAWTLFDPYGKSSNVQVPGKMAANSGDFLMEAAVAGRGLAMLPTFLVWRKLKTGDLVPVLSDYTVTDLDAYAIYPHTRHLSRRVRVFVDFLTDRFGGLPYWDKMI